MPNVKPGGENVLDLAPRIKSSCLPDSPRVGREEPQLASVHPDRANEKGTEMTKVTVVLSESEMPMCRDNRNPWFHTPAITQEMIDAADAVISTPDDELKALIGHKTFKRGPLWKKE
jgi:hypothetical protein